VGAWLPLANDALAFERGGTRNILGGEDGTRILVEEGVDTIHTAVEQASPGDTLVLFPGLYEVTHTVLIDKDLVIKGATKRPQDVHIAAINAEDFDFEDAIYEHILDRGHIFFVNDGAKSVSFKYFTIKNAPEVDISEIECFEAFGLNHSECMGDAIHVDGVANVKVQYVEASLNAGNGIWVDGADIAKFRYIVGVNNGAFGIDIDTANDFSCKYSTFTANQVSGIEASGHPFQTPSTEYVATANVQHVVAEGNSEIGVELERFQSARMENVTCRDNREDGFDADRVILVKLEDCSFINNLGDGVELFPSNVPPEEQPFDFAGSVQEDFEDLEFHGNVGEEVNRPPTEN
jgi:hypothetical protein